MSIMDQTVFVSEEKSPVLRYESITRNYVQLNAYINASYSKVEITLQSDSITPNQVKSLKAQLSHSLLECETIVDGPLLACFLLEKFKNILPDRYIKVLIIDRHDVGHILEFTPGEIVRG